MAAHRYRTGDDGFEHSPRFAVRGDENVDRALDSGRPPDRILDLADDPQVRQTSEDTEQVGGKHHRAGERVPVDDREAPDRQRNDQS